MTAESPVPLRDRRKADRPTILPHGRRVFTLDQVADALQTEKRIVKKLIRLQRQEDIEAAHEGRPPRRVGLRTKQLSERLTRVPEQDLDAYLKSAGHNNGH